MLQDATGRTRNPVAWTTDQPSDQRCRRIAAFGWTAIQSGLQGTPCARPYSLVRATAPIALVAVAAPSSLANPMAAENFLPTTWAIMNAMLTLASEMARERRAPRP